MSTKVTERGQITIPKPLRQKYGLRPSVEVDVVEEDDRLVIVKSHQPATPAEKVFGIVRSDESTDDYIAAIRGR